MNFKKTKLSVLFMITGLLVCSQLTRPSEAEGQERHRVEIAGINASVSERLGADDNPAFIVHFTGDVHGSLEDCGCKGGGFGGLMRRVAYINASKAKFKGVPMLLVDNGGSFADDRTTHNFMRVDAVVKNNWMLQAHDQYYVDAINLSATDWRYLARLIEKNEYAAKSQSQPSLTRIVSANVVSSAPVWKPQPFLIKEINLPNQPSPTRVAFIGLTETGINLPSIFTVTDPVAAAKQVVPEAKRNADIVIIIAHIKPNDATQIARSVPGINVLITSSGDIMTPFVPPLKYGDTLIEFTPFETRLLGELRFYKDAQGKFSVRDRYISLDDGMKSDPAAAEMAAESKKAKNDAYKEMQTILAAWQMSAASAANAYRPKVPAGATTATFISAQACAQCHMDAYIKWVNTKHTKTGDSLAFKKDEFDTSCLQCHGSIRQGDDPLPVFASVQCEQCHGPGSLHAAKPSKGYGKIADMKSACLSCHTPQINPKFDLPSAWLKMKH